MQDYEMTMQEINLFLVNIYKEEYAEELNTLLKYYKNMDRVLKLMLNKTIKIELENK